MKYFRSIYYPVELVISENINKDFSSHNHANHYIISLCARGNVTATLEGKTLPFKENDLFVVSPFMPHAVSLTNTCVLISLCIHKSFIEDYDARETAEILDKILSSPDLRKELTKQQKKRLLRAVSYIYESHDTHKEVHSPGAMENDMLILCDRLTGNLSETISLERLASDLYINKYYLIRKCKKNLGLSPHKFHLQNRIRKAQKLLIMNNSITEASVNTGFYDQSHFDKTFKKIVGISPTEYLASSKPL